MPTEDDETADYDEHFPVAIDRDYEERLLELCASDSFDASRWAALGSRFFMAGLAVMLANDERRPALLALAEELYPGATQPEVFGVWLRRTPVKPSRFLPMVKVRRSAARRRST